MSTNYDRLEMMHQMLRGQKMADHMREPVTQSGAHLDHPSVMRNRNPETGEVDWRRTCEELLAESQTRDLHAGINHDWHFGTGLRGCLYHGRGEHYDRASADRAIEEANARTARMCKAVELLLAKFEPDDFPGWCLVPADAVQQVAKELDA